MKVLVIHGPNLGLLGRREPEIYGSLTLAEVDVALRRAADLLGMELDIEQRNGEGEIIDLLAGGVDRVAGAVLNPGAYAHTSRAIADAIRAVNYPVIEVHLSNIHAREGWRRRSVTGEAAFGVVSGLGVNSYIAALHALGRLARPAEEDA